MTLACFNSFENLNCCYTYQSSLPFSISWNSFKYPSRAFYYSWAIFYANSRTFLAIPPKFSLISSLEQSISSSGCSPSARLEGRKSKRLLMAFYKSFALFCDSLISVNSFSIISFEFAFIMTCFFKRSKN